MFGESIEGRNYIAYDLEPSNTTAGTTYYSNSKNVIFDIDIKGGVNVKNFYGDNALSLFIQPPGIEELRRRLVGRATDTAEQIEIRLAKAEYEMSFASKFDRIIINDDLEMAKAETLRVITEYLNRK